MDEDAENNETWTIVEAPTMTSADPDERGRRNRLPIEPQDYPVAEYPIFALRIFRHPWFMRIWILQEIAYAERIIFQVGKKTTYWDEVLEWVGACTNRVSDDRNTKIDEPTKLSMAMVLLMADWRHNIVIGRYSSSLANVLYQAQWCGATDPKDKVFAILSLASDIDNDFQINYEWSWAEISTRLTRHTIEDNRTLDMLRCIRTRTPLSTTDEERSPPSWIPNLSGLFQSSPLQRHNRYEYEHSLPEERPFAVGLCNDTTLAVKCLYLTPITHVEPGTQSYDTQKSSLYSLLDTFTDWFWAVRVHHSQDEKHKWSLRDSLNEFWSTIRMTRGSDAVYEHVGRKYDTGEGWHWHWRRMFADGTMAQDFVQFAQPENPFIPETSQKGNYEVVSAAYIHQIFDWKTFESQQSLDQLQWIHLV